MSNNLNRTFLTHLDSMAHAAQVRSQSGTWVNVPRQESQKTCTEMTNFSAIFGIFPVMSPPSKKMPHLLSKILTTRLMPQLRLSLIHI